MVYSVRIAVEGFGYDSNGARVALPVGERFFVTYEHSEAAKPLLYGYADTASAKSLWISKELVSALDGAEGKEESESEEEDLPVAEVLHAYKGHGLLSGCLSIRKGEVLYILEEDYSEGWYFAVNARGEEGVVPKSYVKILEKSAEAEFDEATQTATSAVHQSTYSTSTDTSTTPSENSSTSESNEPAEKTLVDICGKVLLEVARSQGDLLNEAVFQNIKKHCSKRFSRVVLLTMASDPIRKQLKERDNEIAALKQRIKEMGKLIVEYENAEWLLKELGKSTQS